MGKCGILLVVVLLAPAAQAQTPLSADAFDSYTQGKTLYYGQSGQAYGIEEYFPRRRVRWSFLEGDCVEGTWYPADDMICFSYEGDASPQCWHFFLEGGTLSARVADDPDSAPLYEVEQSRAPMACLGPQVGT